MATKGGDWSNQSRMVWSMSEKKKERGEVE